MKSTSRFSKNKRGTTCLNCENTISDQNNFCPNCGSKLSGKGKFCALCGSEIN